MQTNKDSAPSRKPARLSTGNYRDPGLYFLTGCSFGNNLLFGSINGNSVTLNTVGIMVNNWWEKLPGKFLRIELCDFILMPNHFHGVIRIERLEPQMGLRREEPRMILRREEQRMNLIREEQRMNLRREEPRLLPYETALEQGKGFDPRVEPGIPRIMQWFKTMSTNEYLRMQKETGATGSPRLWQRSYYDHIIRNDTDYNRIAEYIQHNPGKWMADRFHR